MNKSQNIFKDKMNLEDYLTDVEDDEVSDAIDKFKTAVIEELNANCEYKDCKEYDGWVYSSKEGENLKCTWSDWHVDVEDEHWYFRNYCAKSRHGKDYIDFRCNACTNIVSKYINAKKLRPTKMALVCQIFLLQTQVKELHKKIDTMCEKLDVLINKS